MCSEINNIERKYLEEVNTNLDCAIEDQREIIIETQRQIDDLQNYYVNSRGEIDDAEVANIETELATFNSTIQHGIIRQNRLKKIQSTPYFGRIDFIPEDIKSANSIYIGVHDFEHDRKHYIHDWRAPISSMFYEFKLGPAHYLSPSGVKKGHLELKRQFKIHSGKLQYLFDTSLSINDEILQKELGTSTSSRMRNIVNTIQEEQNRVIRNMDDSILVIQGHAGSGKTSIALHRMAFLLYNNRKQLKSEDILIISPNKIFSDYVSSVLPELGEEKLTQIDIVGLVKRYIDSSIKFSIEVFDNNKDSDQSDISYLSSSRIIKDIDSYASYLKINQFQPKDLNCVGISLSAEELLKFSRRSGGASFAERRERLVDYLVDEFEYRTRRNISKSDKSIIRDQVFAMYSCFDGIQNYVNFFNFVGFPEMAPTSSKVLPWKHVFPFLYLKLKLGIIHPCKDIKHIVIDEMQDYTPLQHRMIKDFFNASMTILGDANQSIRKDVSFELQELSEALPGCDIVFLNKTYRSTLQIMNLAQYILPSPGIEIIKRNGDMPTIIQCADTQTMLEKIVFKIKQSLDNGRETIGVITRDSVMAERLFEDLQKHLPNLRILTERTKTFKSGVSVAPISLAKGIEFDHVIVPDVDYFTYHTEYERHLLYVAVTRAKHSLDLFFQKQLSPFLEKAPVEHVDI